MINLYFEEFQSVCLIISSVLIMITVIGILRLNDDVDKVVYVRIHLLGIVDIAGVLAMIGLNQPLLACIYFILAPIVAHAMANAYYYGEDDRGYESDLNDGVTDYEISDSEDGYELSKLNMVHED